MKTNKNKLSGEINGGVIFALALILGLLIIVGMAGCPHYKVFSQRKDGEAMLAHAQSSKEVAVAEAKAKMESADFLAQAELVKAKVMAQAEIERAKGVAQANQIIGDSLKGNAEYLRYLWITGLENNNPTVIYVPTEGSLPILEASRRIPNNQ